MPTDPVSVAVALADKLDTLVGFWAIDEKPTGSKDPFALRRAALGVIRIVVENGVKAGLRSLALTALDEVITSISDNEYRRDFERASEMDQAVGGDSQYDEVFNAREAFRYRLQQNERAVAADLLSFFHDRLKIYLRDQGARHDLIDAVLASGSSRLISPLAGEMSPKATEGVTGGSAGRQSAPSPSEATPPAGSAATLPARGREGAANDDLLTIVRRVEALGSFLDGEDGKNLLAGTKRAANILAAEEKKGTAIAESVDPALFNTPHEQALFAAMNQAEREAGEAIEKEDFSGAMRALSALREPVDSFFEHVLVNDADPSVRANRLALLARIRAATGQVADFSKIAG